MKKNLLIISDGNGVENDFKKWPLLLQMLTTKSLNIINKSVVGASNEMMQLAEIVAQQPIDYAIIQWTRPRRVDVVTNDFWDQQAAADPVYHFNLIKNNNQTWWVTSASTNSYIKEYHTKYINQWQAVQRTQTYIIAAAELLKFHNIEFAFSLCYELDFIKPIDQLLRTYNWAWHIENQGISEFRHTSKYLHLDYDRAQVHPLIALEWINRVVKPSCKFIDYSDEVYYNVEQSLVTLTAASI